MNYKRTPGHKSVEGKPKKVTPYDDAQRVLEKGWGCEDIKDTMTFVYEDLMNDLFKAWIETKHHENQAREFIYHQAVSLGAVQANIERAVTAKTNKTRELEGDDDE
jgi:hypothetical protein